MPASYLFELYYTNNNPINLPYVVEINQFNNNFISWKSHIWNVNNSYNNVGIYLQLINI